jgi:hypothetical protein
MNRSRHCFSIFFVFVGALSFVTTSSAEAKAGGLEISQVRRQTIFPMPSTDDVAKAMPGWLWLCLRLGVKPGVATNVSEVDWDKTLVYTHYWFLSTNDMVCRIVFKTGAVFLSLRGAAIGYIAPDASTQPGRGWPYFDPPPFKGTIKYRWQDLAEKLQDTLTDRLGIPKECLIPYCPRPGSGAALAALGSNVRERRATILWRTSSASGYNELQGCGAEFDLETGELKELGLTDPAILKAIARAQGKPL